MKVYVVTSTIAYEWPCMRSDTFVFDRLNKAKAKEKLEAYCSHMEYTYEVKRNDTGDFAKFVSRKTGKTVGWIDIKLKTVNPEAIEINEIPT